MYRFFFAVELMERKKNELLLNRLDECSRGAGGIDGCAPEGIYTKEVPRDDHKYILHNAVTSLYNAFDPYPLNNKV